MQRLTRISTSALSRLVPLSPAPLQPQLRHLSSSKTSSQKTPIGDKPENKEPIKTTESREDQRADKEATARSHKDEEVASKSKISELLVAEIDEWEFSAVPERNRKHMPIDYKDHSSKNQRKNAETMQDPNTNTDFSKTKRSHEPPHSKPSSSTQLSNAQKLHGSQPNSKERQATSQVSPKPSTHDEGKKALDSLISQGFTEKLELRDGRLFSKDSDKSFELKEAILVEVHTFGEHMNRADDVVILAFEIGDLKGLVQIDYGDVRTKEVQKLIQSTCEKRETI